jgi:hypothetical protein
MSIPPQERADAVWDSVQRPFQAQQRLMRTEQTMAPAGVRIRVLVRIAAGKSFTVALESKMYVKKRCRHLCGRLKELSQVHALLEETFDCMLCLYAFYVLVGYRDAALGCTWHLRSNCCRYVQRSNARMSTQ